MKIAEKLRVKQDDGTFSEDIYFATSADLVYIPNANGERTENLSQVLNQLTEIITSIKSRLDIIEEKENGNTGDEPVE